MTIMKVTVERFKMNFAQQVEANCATLPYERITISAFNELKIATIAHAALFVFASWSGTALVSFRLLCEFLARKPEAKFPIIVLSADEIDFELFKSVFGELPHGKGETFWIKGGRVIFRDHGFTEKSANMLQTRIDALLSS